MTWPANGSENWNDTMKAHVEVSLAVDGKVKDGAVTATDAPPTVPEGIANKKFVEDTGNLSQSGYVDRAIATEYTAGSDTFVIAFHNGETDSATMQALVSTTAGGSPTLKVQDYEHNGGFGVGTPNFSFVVPAGFKWRVNSSRSATVRSIGQ